MNPTELIDRLEAGAVALQGVTCGLGTAEAARRPAPDRWSLLEIVCHVLDEEREDFRVRLDYTLHRSGEPWPGIDPVGWVTERGYLSQDLEATMVAFGLERRRSLEWLRGLVDPDWDACYAHPKLGVIRAGDLLASWCAHDLLHLRQIAAWHWTMLNRASDPFDPDYAGRW